jgi:DNA-binding SARP family transcriptional activator
VRGRALVAAEPLRDGAHRALMATYAAVGEATRALAHFDALAKRLARDVGGGAGARHAEAPNYRAVYPTIPRACRTR